MWVTKNLNLGYKLGVNPIIKLLNLGLSKNQGFELRLIQKSSLKNLIIHEESFNEKIILFKLTFLDTAKMNKNFDMDPKYDQ